MVLEAEPLARQLVWRMWKPNQSISSNLISYEDILQEALYGLCLAAQRYDPDKGVKWTTYAWRCAYGRICNYFRDKGSHFTVPRKIRELAKQIEEGESPEFKSHSERIATENFLSNKGLTSSYDYLEPNPNNHDMESLESNLPFPVTLDTLKPLADLSPKDFRLLEDYYNGNIDSGVKLNRALKLIHYLKVYYQNL